MSFLNVILLLLLSIICTVIHAQIETAYPSSQPTGGYVAPSNHIIPVPKSSTAPTAVHPPAEIGGAQNEIEEIKEEADIAMSSSYLILSGLVFLVVAAVLYYAYKRYTASHKPDISVANQKYTAVQTDDHDDDGDEFFSRENIEMAMLHNRGGMGY